MHQFGKPKHDIQFSSKCWSEYQLLSQSHQTQYSQYVRTTYQTSAKKLATSLIEPERGYLFCLAVPLTNKVV